MSSSKGKGHGSAQGSRPPLPRTLSELQRAAQELTLAAQAAPSRPTSEADPFYGDTANSSVFSSELSNTTTQTNSPWNDPKFTQGRDQFGRKPSAAGRFAPPEEFYRSGTPSPARSVSKTTSMSQTPEASGKSKQVSGPMERFLNESSRQPKPLSEDTGLCTYEIQAQRLCMARLWAAKTLVEQAYTYKDLDASVPKEQQPLYSFRDRLEEIMFQITDMVTRLGNNKLVKGYEQAFTIPKNSTYFGKDFNKVVPADAGRMLSGVQAVSDQIVREIQ